MAAHSLLTYFQNAYSKATGIALPSKLSNGPAQRTFSIRVSALRSEHGFSVADVKDLIDFMFSHNPAGKRDPASYGSVAMLFYTARIYSSIKESGQNWRTDVAPTPYRRKAISDLDGAGLFE